MTLADVEPALIAVVLITPVSDRSVPPAIFTTAYSSVPALFNTSTIMLDATALTVPSVAVEGITKAVGEPVIVAVAPLVSDVLNASEYACDAIVTALEAREIPSD
jgi:hypothetical protein